MMDEQFLRNREVSKVIRKVRGGSLTTALIVNAIFLSVVYGIWLLGGGAKDFVPNGANPGWELNRPNPFQPPSDPHKFPPYREIFSPRRTPSCSSAGSPSTLEINRPNAVPHQDFVSMSKEDRRQLPYVNDMIMQCEGRPQLRVGFWQSRFKVADHGAIHDLPYTTKTNGGTKTEKTDDNAFKMMRSIVDMPNRENVKWFEDGTYQGGSSREFDAIHIYDFDNRVIAVFRKDTGNFVTTCQLSKKEHDELESTGNFGGGEGWFSGQVKNLPPEQITPVNTFESEVMEMTPMTSMDENSSPNQGFTPINNFENDVMGITPIDNSQVDN